MRGVLDANATKSGVAKMSFIVVCAAVCLSCCYIHRPFYTHLFLSCNWWYVATFLRICAHWRQRWMKCLFQRFPPCYHWNEGWTKKPKVISLSISIIRHFGNILPQFGTIAELSLNWCVFRANGALPRPNEIVSYFLDCFLVLLYLWFDGYSTAKEPRILAIYHIVASCIITPREKFLQKNKF